VIDEGIKKVYVRRAEHYKRALMAFGLIFVIFWLMPVLSFLTPVAGAVLAFEVFNALVVVQTEVNALKQLREEMKHQEKNS
jgi:hypothetical protein